MRHTDEDAIAGFIRSSTYSWLTITLSSFSDEPLQSKTLQLTLEERCGQFRDKVRSSPSPTLSLYTADVGAPKLFASKLQCVGPVHVRLRDDRERTYRE